jgi:hypothetical protein
VKLTFDGIPERLVVPFAAIRVFFDPSVRYGLQFEDPDAEPEAGESMTQRFSGRGGDRANGRATTLRSTAPKKPRVPRKGKGDKSPHAVPGPETVRETVPGPVPGASAPPPKLTIAPMPSAAEDKPRQDNGGAQILSLDAFRKK